MSPPTLFFFFNIVLAILDPLNFYMNFKINLSISAKEAAGLLIEIVLSLWISLGSIAILTISSLQIHEHKRFSTLDL